MLPSQTQASSAAELIPTHTDLLARIPSGGVTAIRLARNVALPLPAVRAALSALVSVGALTQRGDTYTRRSAQPATLYGAGFAEAAEKAVLAALSEHVRVHDEWPSARDLAITANLSDADALAALERLRGRDQVLRVRPNHGPDAWYVRDAALSQADQRDKLWPVVRARHARTGGAEAQT